MSAYDIQKKVKKGLAKAQKKAGSTASPKVYLEQEVIAGGNSPLNPPTVTVTNVELVNAVFKSINQDLIDNTNILSTDVMLVTDGYVTIDRNEKITSDSKTYVVVANDLKAPFGISLANILILRLQ
jgi:hypothetical protein